jgi:hypothetical protein
MRYHVCLFTPLADDDRFGSIGVVCYGTALEEWTRLKPWYSGHQGFNVTGFGNTEHKELFSLEARGNFRQAEESKSWADVLRLLRFVCQSF